MQNAECRMLNAWQRSVCNPSEETMRMLYVLTLISALYLHNGQHWSLVAAAITSVVFWTAASWLVRAFGWLLRTPDETNVTANPAKVGGTQDDGPGTGP